MINCLYAERKIALEDRSQTRIQVKILSMLGSKLDKRANCFKPVKFNINANLEEIERGVNKVSLKFAFTIVTDPLVAKYQVEGTTEIEGQMAHIKKALTPHPSTRVPMVLYDIYQEVYPAIFVLGRTIDAPCPLPELLSTGPAMPSTTQEMQKEPQQEPPEQGQVESSADEKISVPGPQ